MAEHSNMKTYTLDETIDEVVVAEDTTTRHPALFYRNQLVNAKKMKDEAQALIDEAKQALGIA